ncbi:hypothetical protein [Streptomyces sp. NBC_01443]|uniref:hypothetical protein n=1 Tax=Streptomyces sp. NBC_01443 TaxID=2903868 RepID=UPI0022548A22|nr:hypothetical protein [Streptomyces sp. NBC_01443]MCX4632689.1 hypothetical protein [Streptomyces sp. NBC_01443]
MSTADVVRGSSKPGPELGGIVDTASLAHRLWLEPLRDAYFASKLTTEEISEKSRCVNGVKRLSSKGKVSELLRGAKEYPRWYRVLALYDVLSPSDPSLEQLMILWRTGALAAGRKANWINRCLDDVRREAGAGSIRQAGFTTTGRPVAAPPADQVVRARAPKTVMVISTIIAIVVGFLGLNMGASDDAMWRHRAVTTCSRHMACALRDSQPSLRSYYINVRPPTDTRNMLRVVLSKDTRVSSFSSAAVGLSPYWAREDDVLFLSCRVGRNLVVAGTGYYVHDYWLMAYEGVSEEDISALPVCGTQGTSASTPPQE